MDALELINLVLFAILAVTGLAIVRMRALYAVAMLSGIFSLVSASLFVLMDAVDVAFTEVAVGAGISTVLFISALALTRSKEAVTPSSRSWPALVVTLVFGATMIHASLDLPPFGSPDNPVHSHPVTQVFLEDSAKEIGVPNVVTSILASYRGHDTLGEVVVVFTAGIAVLMLLGHTRGRRRGHKDRG